MKIDDNKPGAVDLRRPPAKDAAVARAPEAPATPPAAAAGPAASVSLGSGANVAATVAAAGAAGADEMSDVELLDKLRERIEKGEFEVDYQKLARSVLDDAMATARRRDESN